MMQGLLTSYFLFLISYFLLLPSDLLTFTASRPKNALAVDLRADPKRRSNILDLRNAVVPQLCDQ